MSNCAVCHEPVKSGIVVHSECMEQLRKAQQLDDKPLTADELRYMGGEPYWHVGLQPDSPPPHWVILDPMIARCPEDYRYGEQWLAYRRKPREWISVEDRLPIPYMKVLTSRLDDVVSIDYVEDRNCWAHDHQHKWRPVTHWMPLPAPPEVER